MKLLMLKQRDEQLPIFYQQSVLKLKKMEKTLTRKLTIGYNFLMSNKLIPPNVKKITQPQFKSFFKNFTDNYIFENRTIFDLLY